MQLSKDEGGVVVRLEPETEQEVETDDVVIELEGGADPGQEVDIGIEHVVGAEQDPIPDAEHGPPDIGIEHEPGIGPPQEPGIEQEPDIEFGKIFEKEFDMGLRHGPPGILPGQQGPEGPIPKHIPELGPRQEFCMGPEHEVIIDSLHIEGLSWCWLALETVLVALVTGHGDVLVFKGPGSFRLEELNSVGRYLAPNCLILANLSSLSCL